MAVTVRVRDLTRPSFDPRVLAYRVIDDTGAAYPPQSDLGTAPALGRAPQPLASRQLVETRLGFRVPRRAAALRLRFSLGPGAAPIVIALGG